MVADFFRVTILLINIKNILHMSENGFRFKEYNVFPINILTKYIIRKLIELIIFRFVQEIKYRFAGFSSECNGFYTMSQTHINIKVIKIVKNTTKV